MNNAVTGYNMSFYYILKPKGKWALVRFKFYNTMHEVHVQNMHLNVMFI